MLRVLLEVDPARSIPHERMPDVTIPRLRDRAASLPIARRPFAWHKAQVGHEVPRRCEAPPVADLREEHHAARALKTLPAFHRAAVRDALETHLRHEPAKVSQSRIKRLRGLTQPQYRLRVGEFRVFYDLTNQEVQVLAIVSKAEAQAWLDTHGAPGP